MKLILLNGPPRSGKDTAARFIVDEPTLISNPTVFEKFSLPIKHAFAGMMMTGVDDWGNVEGYEADKSSPIPLLGNVSYRAWQIAFAEDFMRHSFGTNIFSKLLLSRLEEYQRNEEGVEWLCVISDCGFQAEVDFLTREFPPSDTALFNIERPGTSFAGDSRETVVPSDPAIFHSILANDSTLDEFRSRVIAATLNFLEGRIPPNAS